MTEPLPQPLRVSVAWLKARLHQPQTTIVDCRFALMQPEQGQQQYQTSHVPGAFYLDLNRDLSSPVQQHGGRHPLPNMAGFVAKLESIGISSHPLQLWW